MSMADLLLIIGVVLVGVALVTVVLALGVGAGQPTGVARSLTLIERTVNQKEVGKNELPVMERLVAPFLGKTRALAFRISPAGSMEMTISAFSTQLLALATICTPSRADVSREAGTTSKPRTCSPPLTRLAAMGPPMFPRPMNPIFAMCGALLLNLRNAIPGRRRI